MVSEDSSADVGEFVESNEQEVEVHPSLQSIEMEATSRIAAVALIVLKHLVVKTDTLAMISCTDELSRQLAWTTSLSRPRAPTHTRNLKISILNFSRSVTITQM